MTTPKHLVIKLFLPTLALLTAATNTSYGFAEVARGALLLQTTGTLTYDSYFLGSPTQGDDYYVTVTPQLKYSRNVGLSKFNASAGMAFSRYDENTRFDSEDIVSSLTASLPVVPGSRISGDISASYNQGAVVDEMLRDRIITNAFVVSTQLAYQLGLKTSLSNSLSYMNTERDNYGDSTAWTENIGFNYRDFLRGTNLSVNYQYNRNESTGVNYLAAPLDQKTQTISTTVSRPVFGPVVGSVSYGYRMLDRSAKESTIGQTSNNSTVFSAGLSGPFLPQSRFPKLESSMSISYESSATPGINDTGGRTLVGNLRLGWNARERTKLFITASRSLDLSANDLTVENNTVSTGINQQIGLSVQANATVTYAWRDYRGINRNDDDLTALLGLSRTFNKYLSAGITYQFQDKHADASGFQPVAIKDPDYKRHLVSLSVTGTF